MAVFERSFVVHTRLEKVWKFHSDPVALTRIAPWPIHVRIRAYDDPIQNGSKVLMTWSLGPLTVHWDSVVTDVESLQHFTDEQIKGRGPFYAWRHIHSFKPSTEGILITDHVEYEMLFGIVGRLADRVVGRFLIKAMFTARARATKACLEGQTQSDIGTNVHTATSA